MVNASPSALDKNTLELIGDLESVPLEMRE
jgi:hypothetical protein